MSKYDVDEFDPPPDPDLVCPICQCVLHMPMECPCRHVFCQLCIETWLGNSNTCPTCRDSTAKESLRPVLPIIQNMINRLTMRCRNEDHGCVVRIPLEKYEDHVNDCGFTLEMCRFPLCGDMILQKDRESHEEECECRTTRCTGRCKLMVAFKDKQSHNCFDALVKKVHEQEGQLDRLRKREQELLELKVDLKKQLEDVNRRYDEVRSGASYFPGIGNYMDDDDDNDDDVNLDLDDHSSSAWSSDISEYTVNDDEDMDDDEESNDGEENVSVIYEYESSRDDEADDNDNPTATPSQDEDEVRVISENTDNDHGYNMPWPPPENASLRVILNQSLVSSTSNVQLPAQNSANTLLEKSNEPQPDTTVSGTSGQEDRRIITNASAWRDDQHDNEDTAHVSSSDSVSDDQSDSNHSDKWSNESHYGSNESHSAVDSLEYETVENYEHDHGNYTFHVNDALMNANDAMAEAKESENDIDGMKGEDTKKVSAKEKEEVTMKNRMKVYIPKEKMIVKSQLSEGGGEAKLEEHANYDTENEVEDVDPHELSIVSLTSSSNENPSDGEQQISKVQNNENVGVETTVRHECPTDDGNNVGNTHEENHSQNEDECEEVQLVSLTDDDEVNDNENVSESQQLDKPTLQLKKSSELCNIQNESTLTNYSVNSDGDSRSKSKRNLRKNNGQGKTSEATCFIPKIYSQSEIQRSANPDSDNSFVADSDSELEVLEEVSELQRLSEQRNRSRGVKRKLKPDTNIQASRKKRACVPPAKKNIKQIPAAAGSAETANMSFQDVTQNGSRVMLSINLNVDVGSRLKDQRNLSSQAKVDSNLETNDKRIVSMNSKSSDTLGFIKNVKKNSMFEMSVTSSENSNKKSKSSNSSGRNAVPDLSRNIISGGKLCDISLSALNNVEEESSSDEEWKPPNVEPEDLSISESDDLERDSDYSVEIPQSNVLELLNSYDSDMTDDTWEWSSD